MTLPEFVQHVGRAAEETFVVRVLDGLWGASAWQQAVAVPEAVGTAGKPN